MSERPRLPLVVLVDDQPEIVAALTQLLQAQGYATLGFGSAEALLAYGVPASAGCLLLDIAMPGGMNGLALLETLRQRGVQVPALMVSGAGDIPMAVRALRAGAHDFIEKPYAAKDVLAALTACMQPRSMVATPAEVTRRLKGLTRREREVMEAMAAGLSNKEIARQLGISARTVEIHRANLKDKLGARNAADVVRILYGQGGASSPALPSKAAQS